jgi:serine/threonine protein kinase
MECSLHEKIYQLSKSNLFFSGKQIKHIFRQIVEGLDHLHQNQIMHRDLKTSNILFEKMNIKIADLGFSRHFNLPFGLFSSKISNFTLKF